MYYIFLIAKVESFIVLIALYSRKITYISITLMEINKKFRNSNIAVKLHHVYEYH